MKNKKAIDDDSVSLLGIIIPADWDDDGKAIAYTLSTFDEKEYRIDHYDQQPDFEYFIGEKVVIKGKISQMESCQFLRINTIWIF